MIHPIAVVIPALDAEPTLPTVIAGVKQELPGSYIIGVDDGSADGTRAVMRSLCDQTIEFGVNQGKGVALRAGFKAALEHGAVAVLTIDSDGQHDPSFAPAIVAGLNDADIVVGTRNRSDSPMPLHRRIANACSSAVTQFAAGCPIPDSQSGYRAIKSEVIRAIEPTGNRYEYETDFLILAARAGFKITGVPIPTIYGAPSHFDEIRDAWRVTKLLWRRLPVRSNRTTKEN